MTNKDLMIECDMLQGNINRIMVTDDLKEAKRMYEFACKRIDTIYQCRRLDIINYGGERV